MTRDTTGPYPGFERDQARALGRKAEPTAEHQCEDCGRRFERCLWATTGMKNYCDECYCVSGDDEIGEALRGRVGTPAGG